MEITEERKRRVWEKGIIVPHYDPAKYRKDACGAWIAWNRYDDKHSQYGWQIDHIYPEARLKSLPRADIDNIINLRPLHWKNNESKGADYPTYHSVVKAVDDHNEYIDDTFEVNAAIQEKLKKLYGGI